MIDSFAVAPLTPVIGAEVTGLDLSKPLSDGAFDELYQTFLEHQVLFFRDQALTMGEHKALGQRFGELHVHPAARDYREGLEDHPEILVVHADKDTKRIAGDKWHTDVSCDPEPPMASILKLHVVPPTGGDTLFASMYEAYDALSETMKKMLEGLAATHDGGPNYENRANLRGIDVDASKYPRASHPVIRTHPVTGRKALFVNRVFTTHIDGMAPDESEALLNFLYDHAAKPQFQCRFRWQKDSIALWDNRCVMHHAMWDYYPQVRSGYRVTVKGDRPFFAG